MTPEQLRAFPRQVFTLARMGKNSGLWRHLRPRGLVLAARALGKGASGPSAIFRIHGANVPERTAFEFEGKRYTYGHFDECIDRLAAGLRAAGVRAGDAAVMVLKNRPESLMISAAMSRLGGSGVTASWRSTPAELAYLVNHSGARVLFFEAELAPLARAAQADCPNVQARAMYSVGAYVEGSPSIDDLLAHSADRSADAQEGAIIIYTSGTTGRPKGAVRRFGRGQVEGFFSFLDESAMRAGDRHLAICPMYHSTALGFLGMTLIVAGTVVIEREFEPRRFLHTLIEGSIDTTALVPTMLHRLMALPDEAFAVERDRRSLRAIFCVGAQLPGPLGVRTIEQLGPVLYNVYGATETGLVTLATPQDLMASPGTIGRPLPGVELALLDDAGAPVHDGEAGELFTRNAMLVEGYHDDERATRESQRDGFFSVGDLAVRDAAGRYQIVGRKRDMVISGGVNIYPAEVEAAVEAHPAVAQCAVIGIPDDEWGERLRAFVVLREGHAKPSATELKLFAREQLSGPKTPREWCVLDALPSNATGKVLKRELRAYEGPVESA